MFCYVLLQDGLEYLYLRQTIIRMPVAKSLVWGDKVDSGIGLSYRPASLCSRAGQYDNPMPGLTLSPLVRDYELGYRRASLANGMDEITIKTPNLKCCLYWCLFVDWIYSQ